MGQILSTIPRWLWGSSEKLPLISPPSPDSRQQPLQTTTHPDRHELNSISYGLSTKIAIASSSSSKPSPDTRQQLVHSTHHDQRQLNSISYGLSAKIAIASSSSKPSQQPIQTTHHPVSSRPSGSTSPSLISTSGGVTGASHFQALPSSPTTNRNGTLRPYSPLRNFRSDDHALLRLSIPSKLKTQVLGDGKQVSSALRLQQYHTINEKEEPSKGVVAKNWCDYRICEEEEDEEDYREEQKFFSIQVRWIKHYSSEHKILLVGEGDFSFSAALAEAFVSATNLTATSLDSEESLGRNYKNALPNINRLRRLGAMVMHGVDATKMANDFPLGSMRFDRVVFNFPLAGFFPDKSKEVEIWRHRLLVHQFFENAKRMIEKNGEIHITHKSNGFFKEWNLEFVGTRAVGLRLIEEVAFDFKEYPGYRTKYGFGGDRNFDPIPSKTYKFGLRKQNERQLSLGRFMR